MIAECIYYLWYKIAQCFSPPNQDLLPTPMPMEVRLMVRVLVIGFAKVAIISSSFWFAGILRHSIILRYLFAVLRLLCAV